MGKDNGQKPNEPVPGDLFYCPKCDKKDEVQFRGQKHNHQCDPDDVLNMQIRVMIAKTIQFALPVMGKKVFDLKKAGGAKYARLDISMMIPLDKVEGEALMNWDVAGTAMKEG